MFRSAVVRARRTVPGASVPYMAEAGLSLSPSPRAWPRSCVSVVGTSGTGFLHNDACWRELPKLDPAAWRRLSAGAGSKGERLFDWAYLELADLDGAEYHETLAGLWTRGLLIRRNIADSDLAFFATWCPAGTAMETLVAVEGRRWAIEDSFETAKNELGLDHNETRSWHGWHRHVSLVMLAFAMLAAIRRQANTVAPPKSSLRIIRKSHR